MSVVGWKKDEETGEQLWVVRNSVGTYWGDNGFFYLKIGSRGNLGIETQCTYAVPKKVEKKDNQ